MSVCAPWPTVLCCSICRSVAVFPANSHDGINQLMVSVLYRMELAQRRLAQGDQRALEDLQKGREVLNDAIQEVRRISTICAPVSSTIWDSSRRWEIC